MKRTIASACLVMAALTAAPSRADESITGFVDAAVTHPAIPRSLYNLSPKFNGIAGYVVSFDAAGEDRPFELRRVAGVTGREDLDAWFYRDIAGAGDPCPRLIDDESEGGESGTVCAGASYAVVVLFSGWDAEFELSIG